MKHCLFYITALLFVISGCGNGLTEKVISTYENGQPAKVYVYDSDGRWVREVEYYESGLLKMEGPIENNLRNGEWTAYFPDGKVQSTAVFKDDVCSGKNQIFYENGHLWMDGYYKDDRKCGEWVFYDEQGYEIERADFGPCD